MVLVLQNGRTEVLLLLEAQILGWESCKKFDRKKSRTGDFREHRPQKNVPRWLPKYLRTVQMNLAVHWYPHIRNERMGSVMARRAFTQTTVNHRGEHLFGMEQERGQQRVLR